MKSQKERSKEHHRRKKELFKRLKSDERCFDCGQIYPYYVLQFDHLEGVGNRNNVANLRHANVETLLAELRKCDLICANCHAVRTHLRRQGSPLSQGLADRNVIASRREAKARSLWAEVAVSIGPSICPKEVWDIMLSEE